MCGRRSWCRPRWSRRDLPWQRRSRAILQTSSPPIICKDVCGRQCAKQISRGNMSGLDGRIALVTGASQGIGRACALALAEAGATIALAARNEAKLAEVAAEIATAGGTAHIFTLDVGSEESIKECAKSAIAQLGKVDILINNAGITRDILALRMKRKDWDDVLTTNLTGAFLMTQAVMSSMVKNRWGRIINITSVVGE